MAGMSVRYIVHDVEAALSFYTRLLGFEVAMHPAPCFASVVRGDLRLLMSGMGGGGGGARAMPDGRHPEPGGWNRLQLEAADLASLVDTLRGAGALFRNES
jgi:catechol 2,3-dioxygenase-like lactoylglutathione lyase family enzyme